MKCRSACKRAVYYIEVESVFTRQVETLIRSYANLKATSREQVPDKFAEAWIGGYDEESLVHYFSSLTVSATELTSRLAECQ